MRGTRQQASPGKAHGFPDDMLGLATTAFTIGLVYINLLALALMAFRWTGSYPLARVAAPAGVTLAAFFIE